ncbi:MAG: glycosyltransferase, partial [Balneolaceae bacterium]
MKIVDVAEFYSDKGGGVKTYINQKMEAGRRHGHEVVVIAPGDEDREEERNGGKVIWIKGPKLFLDPNYYVLSNKEKVHAALDKEQPDVVEGSSCWTGGIYAGNWPGDAVKAFIFHQDPIAVYPQTFLKTFFQLDTIDKLFGFGWRYIRKVSHKFDTTIVSGDWLRQRVEHFGLKEPRTVQFGIDKSFFSPKRRNPELRKKLLADLGLDEDATLLIAVSRYHPEKRVSTIIRGFKKASKSKPMGLIIFGSGPLEPWIRFRYKNTPHFKMMGFTKNRDELADIMASCDYFVHGSAAETFGIVVAEAICSGLPFVVPQKGGAVDFADDAYSEVYETGNPKALAASLLKLIERDREKLAGECARVAQQKIVTVQEHFDELFDCYEKLREKKSRG